MAALDVAARANGRAPTPSRHDLGHAVKLGLRIVALLAVIALALVGLQRYRRAHQVPPVHYETARLDRGAVAAKVTATGALSALVTVNVGSQVSGRIEALFADYGSAVKKGQIVARIEPSFFRAAAEQARANHRAAQAAREKAKAQSAQAERQYTRAQLLFSQGLMGKADLDTAESALAVARADVKSAEAAVAQTNAALAQAELSLHYTTIVSPIDGVVISRNVDVGQTVAATLQAPTIFVIAQDLTRMQVDTNVAEGDVGKIAKGMEVTFTVDAYPQRVFHGAVRQVRDNALTVQNVVTYDAVIDVDNSERLLKPGMTASVTFVYARRDAALRVPNAALRFKPEPAVLEKMVAMDPAAATPTRVLAPDERVLWVMRGGTARATIVRIGVTDGSFTEVVSGDLTEGDAAVVEARGAS